MLSSRRLQTITSKGGLILFGVIWTLFSSVFLVIGIWVTWSTIKKSGWDEVPCRVTKFKIEAKQKNDPSFMGITQYSYEWEGKPYTGNQIFSDGNKAENYEKLGEIEHRYQLEQLESCYVNPDDPSEASLIKESWGGAVMGLIFAGMGGVFTLLGIWILFSGSSKTLSSQASGGGVKQGVSIAVLFLGLFGVVGLIAGGVLFFKLREGASSKQWKEAPATVIWSRVISESSDDGTTYKPEVFYRYDYEGGRYRSNSVSRFQSSSSGRDSKQAYVGLFPRKKKFTCYVNPEKPWQATIERGIGNGWLWMLIPLAFILVSIGGIMGVTKRKEDLMGRPSASGVLPAADLPPELLLDPGKKRVQVFVFMTVFSAIWCGVTFIWGRSIVNDEFNGGLDLIPTLFFSVFAMIGIVCIVGTLYSFLRIFAPKPRLMLSPGYLTIGEPTVIAWKISNGGHRVSDLKIVLVGMEEAEYRRGTSTSRDSSCFYALELMTEERLRTTDQGTLEFTLPMDGVIPTWKSEHNAITWHLEVTGKIPMFPDIKDEYDVLVISPSMKGEL